MESPKAREGKGGRGEGREQVQAQLAHPVSTQQCLCQEPAFLKPWARGPALQAEGSPRAGAGKHRGESSASGVSCHAVLGCRQREGGQRLGEGLSQLVCVAVFRKHISLQAACSELCFLHPLQRSSSSLVCLQRPGTARCSQMSRPSLWEGAGVWLRTQLSSGGRALRHREGWDFVGGRRGLKLSSQPTGEGASLQRDVGQTLAGTEGLLG